MTKDGWYMHNVLPDIVKTHSDIFPAVDPHKPSGQNLWRQYAGKKGKIVLNAQWVHECIKTNQLQTFHSNWAGCKVTGTETYVQFLSFHVIRSPAIPLPRFSR